jgi:arylsulfatase
LIAHWPKGIKVENSISDTPLHMIDLMSTFVEITGEAYPQEFKGEKIIPMDGISMLPEFKGNKVERNKPLFWQWRQGKAIRDGNWKWVSFKDEQGLYNLERDPVEARDLSEANPEKLNELKDKYNAWAKDFEL